MGHRAAEPSAFPPSALKATPSPESPPGPGGSAGPASLEPRDVNSSSPAVGHLQKSPKFFGFGPALSTQPLLPETLGPPQDPWVRVEGGPRAVREVPGLDLTKCLGNADSSAWTQAQ